GIASVVICHFSVDALYTAFALIRSPNLYYAVSGTLAAGAFALVFLGLVVAYFVKGGFQPARRTNAEEREMDAALAGELAAAGEAAAEPPAPEVRAAGLSWRAAAAALVIAAVLGSLRLIPLPAFGEWSDYGTSRDQARRAGTEFLKECGFDVGAYRAATLP